MGWDGEGKYRAPLSSSSSYSLLGFWIIITLLSVQLAFNNESLPSCFPCKRLLEWRNSEGRDGLWIGRGQQQQRTGKTLRVVEVKVRVVPILHENVKTKLFWEAGELLPLHLGCTDGEWFVVVWLAVQLRYTTLYVCLSANIILIELGGVWWVDWVQTRRENWKLYSTTSSWVRVGTQENWNYSWITDGDTPAPLFGRSRRIMCRYNHLSWRCVIVPRLFLMYESTLLVLFTCDCV